MVLLRPESLNIRNSSLELLKELERLVAVQRRRPRREHGDRRAPVLDELGDRQVGHGPSLAEHVFAIDSIEMSQFDEQLPLTRDSRLYPVSTVQSALTRQRKEVRIVPACRQTHREVRHGLVPGAVCIVVCAASAVGMGALMSPVRAQQPPSAEVLGACNRLIAFHTKLEKKKNQFSSKRDAKTLDEIADQLQTIQSSDAASVAKALHKAKSGKPRRRAIDKAFRLCKGQGAFLPTSLTVPPSIDAVDIDVVQISGTSEAGASIAAIPGAPGIGNQTVIADGNGAFTLNFPNVPLDQNVSVTISAVLEPRKSSRATTTVRRTISEGAFKAQTAGIPYDELVRNVPGFMGRPVTYRVKVFQFDFNTGTNKFLGQVTQGQYDLWDDVVMFKLSDPSIATGVIKDDIVRVWGTVGAPQSYSTRTGTNSVPTVDVKYLTK